MFRKDLFITQQDENPMLRSIEGIYHQGRIDLLESDAGRFRGKGNRHVLGRWFCRSWATRNRRKSRGGFASASQTFAEDWDRPEMDVYDAV